jgi:hypothetical protein
MSTNNNIPQEQVKIANETLKVIQNKLSKIDTIESNEVKISFAIEKAPHYCTNVEIKNLEIQPEHAAVIAELSQMMFNKVFNLYEEPIHVAKQGLPCDPTQNKNVLNIYRTKLQKLIKKDTNDSVKEYSAIQFIDRVVNANVKKRYVRAIKRVNNQPAIKLNYDIIFEEYPEFRDIYNKNPEFVESQCFYYMELAYNAALKMINTHKDTIVKQVS